MAPIVTPPLSVHAPLLAVGTSNVTLDAVEQLGAWNIIVPITARQRIGQVVKEHLPTTWAVQSHLKPRNTLCIANILSNRINSVMCS